MHPLSHLRVQGLGIMGAFGFSLSFPFPSLPRSVPLIYPFISFSLFQPIPLLPSPLLSLFSHSPAVFSSPFCASAGLPGVSVMALAAFFSGVLEAAGLEAFEGLAGSPLEGF